MKKTIKMTLVFYACLLAGAWTNNLEASTGSVVDLSNLSETERLALFEGIDKARVSHPDLFSFVERAQTLAADAQKSKRRLPSPNSKRKRRKLAESQRKP